MGPYLALFGAGFKRQSTYRASLLTGVVANVFFGIFRTAAFVALYRQRPEVAGLQLADAITYVWMLQMLFGVVFVSWLWEWPDAVRSGDFLVELLRPGDVFSRMLAIDLGRASFMLVARGLPMILVPGLLLDMHLPTSALGLGAVVVSVLLTTVAAFEYRFLVGSMSFWTSDFRGWWALVFSMLWGVGGVIVPVELFPTALRWVASYGPVSSLFVAPIRVVTERWVPGTLALQLMWVFVIGVLCRRLMAVAERSLVVHGG
jgi:ABC-2 type transport system permease protein